MTLGFDGGWHPPSHASRHGGLLPAGSRRSGLHRALRLIMAAAAAAAGLCFVVGLVAIVAAAGGTTKASDAGSARSIGPPSRGQGGPGLTPTATPTPSAPDQTGHPPARSRPGARQFTSGRTIDVFTGSGSGERGTFTVRKPGNWGLAWRFSCPRSQPGDFILGQTGSAPIRSVNVNVSGSSSHGLFWMTGDSGPHSVVVVSECSWIVQVVLPRR